MSLVTVSAKRNREYQRAFDHDEARRLRAEGWTYKRLAEHFGVSGLSVQRLFNERLRQRMDAATKRWIRENRRQPCRGGCGALVWLTRPTASGYCHSCEAKQRTVTVRPESLLCTRCGEWKPDDDFPRATAKTGRRGRHSLCRPCSTEARREYRQRNPKQERDYSRQHKRALRERTNQMTQFIVLQPNGHGYVEVARVEAASAIGAVEKAADAAGDFIAVPASRFRPMRVEPVQKFAVVPQTGATESA